MLVAIDNGHGLNTAGKRTPKFEDGTFMHEWEFNYAVAKYLKIELERCGVNVLMLSDTEEDTPLTTRTNLCNNRKADFCISLHYNALSNTWGKPTGTETFYYEGNMKDKAIADIIHPYIVQATGFKDRGCKPSNFHMVREPKCPAILVEYGFMDNLEEATKALQDDFRRRCAKHTAQGICKAFNVVYVDENIVSEMTVEKAKEIVQSKTGFDNNTMAFLSYYKYSDALIVKLAKAMQ